MATKWPTSEIQVAAPVVAWLRAAGWDVYQEVRHKRSDRSCDIVATRGQIVWAIESKVRLNVDVIEQARWWQQYAHFVSVAVPARYYPTNAVYGLALNTWGIGVFGVQDPAALCSRVMDDDRAQAVRHLRPPDRHVAARSKGHRKLIDQFRASLCEEQRTFLAAGSPCGSGWTPYKKTCQLLADLVKQHPGCTLKEAISGRKATLLEAGFEGIRHHYATDASALGSLPGNIGFGRVPGVRMERDGRALRLYPMEVKS